MAKIKFLDPLLEWTNRHCGCVYLIEYIPFVNPKPSPLPAPPFAVTRSRKERGEGEEEKRREGKLGHVFVDPCRSSPKTGWSSSPLSVFLISMVFPRCSWWCPMCGAAWR